MADTIILGDGPYIVKKNLGGGIEFRYGWSEIIIEGNSVKVSCMDDDNCTRIILNITMKNIIPREYKILEKIEIYLKRGFNSIYAYNYSCIDKFKLGCHSYFRELDENLTKEKEISKICNKCNGSGLVKI
jgi:hypothetical protein